MLESDRNDYVMIGGGSRAARCLEIQPSPFPWVKFDADKPLTAKGTILKYVAPVMKEGKLVRG